MNPKSGVVTGEQRTRPGQRETGVNRVKTPISVLVISIIEIALGLLAIGLVLDSEANGFIQAPVYLSIYSYASALLLAAALGLLVAALLSSPATRLLRLGRATMYVAVAAFVMTSGYALLEQLVTWTTPVMCDGCGLPQSPTVNQMAASVVLDIGGGALAALLPSIVLVVLRFRGETLQAAPVNAATTATPDPTSPGAGNPA